MLTKQQIAVLALVGKYDGGFLAQGRQGRSLSKLVEKGLVTISSYSNTARLTEAGRKALGN